MVIVAVRTDAHAALFVEVLLLRMRHDSVRLVLLRPPRLPARTKVRLADPVRAAGVVACAARHVRVAHLPARIALVHAARVPAAESAAAAVCFALDNAEASVVFALVSVSFAVLQAKWRLAAAVSGAAHEVAA